jgi:5'-methylthioadenosine phosphorylase
MPKAKTKSSKRASENKAEIGIIGGSGLYSMPGLEHICEWRVKTPFGDPSDALVLGTLEGKRVAFLARHGRGHRLMPSEINYRANLYAMKLAGVKRLISVSAVGSLREELRPLEFLIPDQFFDRTYRRISTFFGDGIVAHVGFDRPVCPQLAGVLGSACDLAGVKAHRGGTYVCIEGPQFSTLAEAHVHRQLRFEVIGMTNVTEAKLAREAELCYATVAMITDYDCWHPEHSSVTLAEIIANLNRNAESAASVIRHAVRNMPAEPACTCEKALAHAIITAPKLVPASARKRLAAIIGKYIS